MSGATTFHTMWDSKNQRGCKQAIAMCEKKCVGKWSVSDPGEYPSVTFTFEDDEDCATFNQHLLETDHTI